MCAICISAVALRPKADEDVPICAKFNYRAQSLSDMLNKKGWPSTYISGAQDQQHRLSAMAKLKV